MNDSHVTIEDAYDTLSQEAFAVWIRMMVASDEELQAGRGRLATMLGYSEGRSNQILRELKHKGFLKVVKGDHPGLPTSFELERRAMISGRTRFIRLSSVLASGPVQNEIPPTLSIQAIQANSHRVSQPDDTDLYDPDGNQKRLSSHPGLSFSNKPSDSLIFSFGKSGKLPHKDRKAPKRKWTKSTIAGWRTAHESPPISKPPKQKFLAGKYASQPDLNPTHEQQKRTPPREKYKAHIEREQAKRKEAREKRLHIAKGKSIDWTKLDQRGDPVITFEPTPQQRTEWIKILTGSGRDPRKAPLMKKVGSEYNRIYTRYRREVEEMNGEERTYMSLGRNRAYAQTAGLLCLVHNVTPRQVIEYWHEHVGDFADSKLKIPPLGILAAEGNVERVACSVMEVKTAKGRGWRPGDFQKGVPESHGFSDVSQLDKRLRPGLEAEGFNVRQYTDRHLLTIQKAARTIANGRSLFVSSNTKPMVDWAAVNLFGGGDED